jgi:RimJ/RimL family protein N-acetyltransferase
VDEVISRDLVADDAAELARLLAGQKTAYLANFHPFSFEESALRSVIGDARKDWFRAFESTGKIVGFFMLRGFDAGFSRPSYGVFIAEDFSSKGLGKRALRESIEWGRANGVKSIMLKVSRSNERAARLYVSAGFIPCGVCERTGHTMMELPLRS